MPGFARMKTGAPYGKFGGGKCCPVCLGDYLTQTEGSLRFVEAAEIQRVASVMSSSQTAVSSSSRSARISLRRTRGSEPAELVAEKASVSADDTLKEGGNLPDPIGNTDSAASDAPGSGAVEGGAGGRAKESEGAEGAESAEDGEDAAAVNRIGSSIVSNGGKLMSKVGNLAKNGAVATPGAMQAAAVSMANGAKTLAEGAKTLADKVKSASKSAVDASLGSVSKIGHSSFAKTARDAFVGDTNTRIYDGTLDGVKCCQICIEQLYPPRDFVDVQTFLEVEDKALVPAMIEVQSGAGARVAAGQKRERGQERGQGQGQGFVMSGLKSAGNAIKNVLLGGGGLKVNQYGDSCSCRMCQDNMIGLGGGFFPKPAANGAARKKSRNPMNQRQYPSLVELAASARAPVKGGLPLQCPSLNKGSTACCYLFCEKQFEACEENKEESDRQEDSDCPARKGTCMDECAVGGSAPKTWGTHTE